MESNGKDATEARERRDRVVSRARGWKGEVNLRSVLGLAGAGYVRVEEGGRISLESCEVLWGSKPLRRWAVWA
jgi:hypothetical protein